MLKYLLTLTLIVNMLFAHSHTFVDIYPTIDSENNNIKTIHFKWSFDVMSSQLLQMEFDQSMKIIYEFDVIINTNKEDVQIEFYDTEMFTALS